MSAELTPVTSSSIDAIGHDPSTETLHVRFKNGGTYSYPGVSADEHKALTSADSIGAHFAAHTRPKFKGKKVG